MPRKGSRPEEIIAKLREADVLLGQGKKVGEVVKALGVSEVTYRDELLDREVFHSLREAQVPIEAWRRHHDTVRPHPAPGYRPPAPEAVPGPAWAPPSPAPGQADDVVHHRRCARTDQVGEVSRQDFRFCQSDVESVLVGLDARHTRNCYHDIFIAVARCNCAGCSTDCGAKYCLGVMCTSS